MESEGGITRTPQLELYSSTLFAFQSGDLPTAEQKARAAPPAPPARERTCANVQSTHAPRTVHVPQRSALGLWVRERVALAARHVRLYAARSPACGAALGLARRGVATAPPRLTRAVAHRRRASTVPLRTVMSHACQCWKRTLPFLAARRRRAQPRPRGPLPRLPPLPRARAPCTLHAAPRPRPLPTAATAALLRLTFCADRAPARCGPTQRSRPRRMRGCRTADTPV